MSINNSQDIIDSRDIIDRIEELEQEQTDRLEAMASPFMHRDHEDTAADIAKGYIEAGTVRALAREAFPADSDDLAELLEAVDEWERWERDDSPELDTLRELADEASGSPDWDYGEALIRDSHFREYAQQLAEDCGMLDKADSWPSRCIDWDQAARELQHDYLGVDFGGVDYWIRG